MSPPGPSTNPTHTEQSWTTSNSMTTVLASLLAMKSSTQVSLLSSPAQASLHLSDVFTVADAHAAPYLLSAAADLKSYRDAKGYRKIPVGYSATDTLAVTPMLQDYLVCRPNETERLDFYSLNSYRWCGDATYQTSGYNQIEQMFQNYPVPVFFSETGCNVAPPRTFGDQDAIFGPEMSGTFSGAIIYEWIQEMNNYGLVSYGPQLAADVQEGSRVIQG
jgi:1,3-beta-glucanosyltransferase GAS1